MSRKVPPYILYVIPGDPPSETAVSWIRKGMRVAVMDIKDIPRAERPDWLKGCPLLVDTETHSRYAGSKAVESLQNLYNFLNKFLVMELLEHWKPVPVQYPLPSVPLVQTPAPAPAIEAPAAVQGTPVQTLAPDDVQTLVQTLPQPPPRRKNVNEFAALPPPNLDPNGNLLASSIPSIPMIQPVVAAATPSNTSLNTQPPERTPVMMSRPPPSAQIATTVGGQ